MVSCAGAGLRFRGAPVGLVAVVDHERAVSACRTDHCDRFVIFAYPVASPAPERAS